MGLSTLLLDSPIVLMDGLSFFALVQNDRVYLILHNLNLATM